MIKYQNLLNDIKSNKTTVLEFVNNLYVKIEENKDLNCFITLTKDKAIESAKKSDENFVAGKPRKLEGFVIAIKDNISTKDIRTTCASKMLENYTPVYNATVIEKLLSEGAIIIGKTNMDEFAMGSSNETSFFGGVLNPINKEYVPGGSSGGSAVAVAAGLCFASLGSDTGGSVRQPASFTGIYGFKPTYSRVSRYGMVAFASSLDQIGVFSSNIEDLALVTEIISGYDKNDSTSTEMEAINSLETINANVKDYNFSELKIGLLPDIEIDKCEDYVKEYYYNFLEKLKGLGVKFEYVEFQNTESWIPTYYILATAECSSNLSRFDGVRFGFRPELKENDNIYFATRSQGFGDEVKRRILTGTYVLSSGYYDSYYLKAQKSRNLIFQTYKKAFENVDIVLMPTTPSSAFKPNSKNDNPLTMYVSDFFTASANLAGIPAINIPAGENQIGLPFGMQIQGNNFEDEKLLRISNILSQIS